MFCMPQQEVKTLYSGSSGYYIVHSAFYVGLTPEQRVLSLPADLNLDSCLLYESKHEDDYSPWYKMTEVDDTQS